MLKTIAGLQGVTVLSKESQKKINGGGGATCQMTYQNSAGNWITEVGNCDTATSYLDILGPSPFGSPSVMPSSIQVSFCHTKSFTSPVALSSNGGKSRC